MWIGNLICQFMSICVCLTVVFLTHKCSFFNLNSKRPFQTKKFNKIRQKFFWQFPFYFEANRTKIIPQKLLLRIKKKEELVTIYLTVFCVKIGTGQSWWKNLKSTLMEWYILLWSAVSAIRGLKILNKKKTTKIYISIFLTRKTMSRIQWGIFYTGVSKMAPNLLRVLKNRSLGS
jgi:hypothetical protein